MYTWKLFSHVLKRFDTSCSHNGGRLALFVKHRGPNYGKFGVYRKEINLWLREQGKQVAQACRRQFEFITAQRIRRHIQIFYLYTKIWYEVALKEFMRSWRLRIARNFLLSTVTISMYNWDRERISDEEVNRYLSLSLLCNNKHACNTLRISLQFIRYILSYRHFHEIEWIQRLQECTVMCAKCHLRIVIDVRQPNVKYCKCAGVQCNPNPNCTLALILIV